MNKRDATQKMKESLPDRIVVINDTNLHTGKFSAIMIWTPDGSMFADNTTAMKIEDEGINLNALNSDSAHGDLIPAMFTQIKLGGGTVIAYCEIDEDVAISDLDGDGTTATATATAHGFNTGDEITITGTSSFDGDYTITKVNDNTFTFAHSSSNTNETGTCRRAG